jgi:DNA-binding GntR family transcriptional regulator
MLDVSLERVPRTLLRDEAYLAIRRAIVSGVLAPGDVVRDADLAERLGLSRAPVREALQRLAGDGLVQSKPQSHTRVTPLVARDVRDAIAVVRAMHELATREAVPALTGADVDAMRAANADFAAAVAAGDVDAALAADDALHGVLVTVCGNRAVAATVDRYTPLIERVERRKFGTLSAHRSIQSHARLIDACALGDVDAAVATTGVIFSELVDQLDE